MYGGHHRNGRSVGIDALRYTEEIAGILSLKLYETAACRSIIRQAGALDDWGAAEVGVEEDEDMYGAAVETETRLASALTPASNSEIVRDFNRKMNQLIKPLVKEFWGVSLKKHSDTHLVRYTPGNFYTAHTDAGMDMNDRYFTVLCYLNDSFRGGRTCFPSLNYSVTPRCGKAIIFPSTYVHCAEPVTKGRKYILVSWLIGTEPIRWI